MRSGRFPASRSCSNAPLSKNSLLGRPKCERGAHFCIAKRTPIEDFAFRASKMRAPCLFLHPQTRPCRRFCPSNIQNASVVLIFASPNAPLWMISPFSDVQNASAELVFASPNAPLSQISPFKRPKCERGANLSIPKRTLIADFALRMSKMRAGCSFLHPPTHRYR